MKFSLISKFLFAILLLFLISCNQDDPFRVDYSQVPEPFELTGVQSTETESGLIFYDLEEGEGPFTINRRDGIRVYYTGRDESGRVFDSSYRNGKDTPDFFGDLGSLIIGWREGLIGMKEGQKRVLIIPPSLAYENAPRGSSGYNLRNDTLRFDIEIAEIVN